MANARCGFHASAWGSDHVLLALHEASRAGFQGIEAYSDVSHVLADKPEEFVVFSEIAGVQLAGVHAGGTLTSPDFHASEILAWRVLLEWTKKAGGDYAIYYGGEPSGDPVADMGHASELLNAIGEIAAETGVSFLYEPDLGSPFAGLNAISELIGNTDPANVGVSVDTARFDKMGADPTFFLLQHKARIGVVHLRDVRDPADPRSELDPYADPGRGTLDLKAVADTMRMTGFSGWAIGVSDVPQTNARESAMHTADYFRNDLDFEF